MTVNAIHIPTPLQIQKIYQIIHMIQPKSVSFKIQTDKGKFIKVYDVDSVFDFENDLKDFSIRGPKKESDIARMRRGY